jgi:hypothetical protein
VVHSAGKSSDVRTSGPEAVASVSAPQIVGETAFIAVAVGKALVAEPLHAVVRPPPRVPPAVAVVVHAVAVALVLQKLSLVNVAVRIGVSSVSGPESVGEISRVFLTVGPRENSLEPMLRIGTMLVPRMSIHRTLIHQMMIHRMTFPQMLLFPEGIFPRNDPNFVRTLI